MYSNVSLEMIRKNGRGNAVNVGGWIFMFGCLFTAACFMAAALSGNELWAGVGVAVFVVFSALALLWGGHYLRQSAGQTGRVVDRSIDALEAEYKRKNAAPAALPDPAPAPALPAAPQEDSFVWNHGGVGESVPKHLLHGFDPRELLWVCKSLANGMKWTETQLEKEWLPYSDVPFGKAEKGTPYYRLFDATEGIFIRAGIIIERGGPGNRMGKLAITSPIEMMQRLKALDA